MSSAVDEQIHIRQPCVYPSRSISTINSSSMQQQQRTYGIVIDNISLGKRVVSLEEGTALNHLSTQTPNSLRRRSLASHQYG